MKVIIFEGLDNTGKSTQLELLKKYYEGKHCTVCIKHFNKPSDELNNLEKAAYQNKEYQDYVKELISYAESNKYDYVLIDRCWYSEYVYGQMYRERNEIELLFNIYQCEEALIRNLGIDNVRLFMFTAYNSTFLMNNEDGLSISGGDIVKIGKEMTLFDNIYRMSEIPGRQLVRVNTFLNSNEFRSKQTIFDELIAGITKKCIYKPIYHNLNIMN